MIIEEPYRMFSLKGLSERDYVYDYRESYGRVLLKGLSERDYVYDY
jgi:hypothetical protein